MLHVFTEDRGMSGSGSRVLPRVNHVIVWVQPREEVSTEWHENRPATQVYPRYGIHKKE